MQGADDLFRELDRWTEAGLSAAFWWRDDDAARPTRALDRLVDLARRHRVPLAVAVVPAVMDDALAPVLDDPLVRVLQHGYAHRNHATPGGRAVECGGARPAEAVFAELSAGRARLAAAFGEKFLPVMVPPWNRIAADIVGGLASRGFCGLSVFGPGGAGPLAGLTEVNAHLDILGWKGGARFSGRDKLLRLLAERLADRRLSRGAEPLGLLTHHLDHDEASWDFLDEILGALTAHPAVRWREASRLFGVSPGASSS